MGHALFYCSPSRSSQELFTGGGGGGLGWVWGGGGVGGGGGGVGGGGGGGGGGGIGEAVRPDPFRHPTSSS